MHKHIAIEIINKLHDQFPDASIALTGSVANDTYTESSDIDILFVRKNIHYSYSVKFIYKNINVTLFYFCTGIINKYSNNYLYQYHNACFVCILQSKIIYDNENLILNLKTQFDELCNRRILLKDLLKSELKDNIRQLIDFVPTKELDKKRALYQVMDKILAIFFLHKCTKGALTKQAGQCPFAIIKEENIELYKYLTKWLPFEPNLPMQWGLTKDYKG
jgi:hypothetical protein